MSSNKDWSIQHVWKETMNGKITMIFTVFDLFNGMYSLRILEDVKAVGIMTSLLFGFLFFFSFSSSEIASVMNI